MSIGFKQDITTLSNTHEDIILNIVKFKGILQPGLISNIKFQLQVVQGILLLLYYIYNAKYMY